MTCPNCDKKMNEYLFDHQELLHCEHCGGTYFGENSINRISLNTAKILQKDFDRASDKSNENTIRSNEVHPHFCPRDHGVLLPLYNDETIPNNVELLECHECRGIFAMPDDVLKFKQAQTAKVEYFRLWGKPLPSLQAVLVLSLVLFVGAATYLSVNQLQTSQTRQTQAAEIVQRFSSVSSARYTLISFTTAIPVSSQITLTRAANSEKIVKEITKEPATQHFTTITLDRKETWFYQLRLIDEDGKVIETDQKPLIIQN